MDTCVLLFFTGGGGAMAGGSVPPLDADAVTRD